MDHLVKELQTLVVAMQYNLLFLLKIIAIIWLVNIVNWFILGSRLNILGIYPRHVLGLIGIPCSPVLHGHFNHLFFQYLSIAGACQPRDAKWHARLYRYHCDDCRWQRLPHLADRPQSDSHRREFPDYGVLGIFAGASLPRTHRHGARARCCESLLFWWSVDVAISR